MKKTILLITLLPFFLSSCEQWLDVSPNDQVNEETLFENGKGYRNALNGVYKDMSTTDMYAREMTWGIVDVVGQVYRKSTLQGVSTHAYSKAVSYKFTDKDVKSITQDIWSKTYNAIANCNNIIERIEKENPEKFNLREQERDLILGEALALRAYLHFDMMRLFAPSPVSKDKAGYIPYFESYGSKTEPRLSMDEVVKRVERDLLRAKTLVGAIDTVAEHKIWHATEYRIKGGAGSGSSQMPSDLFFIYRGFRMNYYAITATLARVYAYMGELENAYHQANEILKAKFSEKEGDLCFTFTDPEEVDDFASKPKLYDGVIFALSNKLLIDNYKLYSVDTESSRPKLLLNTTDLFTGDSEDRRSVDLTQTSGFLTKISTKYFKSEGEIYGDDLIPMIRLSEMYYIVCEYLYPTKSAEAVEMLDDVRVARGCGRGKLVVQSVKDMQTQILRDARRDFIGEGQLFYYYKKFGQKPSSDAVMYFPLPDNELIN